MTLEQAMLNIHAAGIFASWRRQAAINALAQFRNKEAIIALASALSVSNPSAELIAATIVKIILDSSNQEYIEALWRLWVANPTTNMAAVLSKLGWPDGIIQERKLAQAVLALATEQASPAILTAVLRFAEKLPTGDEAINDCLYAAWVRTQSPEFELLIGNNGRQPGEPALETLHALVTGQLTRYINLKDEDGLVLTQAVRLAPPSFLQRIAKVLVQASNQDVRKTYANALLQARIDGELRLGLLRLLGDESGLFTHIQTLNLAQVLELCERWLYNQNWATMIGQRTALKQALAAYRDLKNPHYATSPSLPDGLVDLFDYWDEGLGFKMGAGDDPIHRARSLYLRNIRGGNIKSSHWPERLVMRMLDVAHLAEAKNDPLCWIADCAKDAAFLRSKISVTPDEYLQNSKLLAQPQDLLPARTLRLLVILCAFQAEFVGTSITVTTIQEPSERTAIRLENNDEQTSRNAWQST